MDATRTAAQARTPRQAVSSPVETHDLSTGKGLQEFFADDLDFDLSTNIGIKAARQTIESMLTPGRYLHSRATMSVVESLSDVKQRKQAAADSAAFNRYIENGEIGTIRSIPTDSPVRLAVRISDLERGIRVVSDRMLMEQGMEPSLPPTDMERNAITSWEQVQQRIVKPLYAERNALPRVGDHATAIAFAGLAGHTASDVDQEAARSSNKLISEHLRERIVAYANLMDIGARARGADGPEDLVIPDHLLDKPAVPAPAATPEYICDLQALHIPSRQAVNFPPLDRDAIAQEHRGEAIREAATAGFTAVIKAIPGIGVLADAGYSASQAVDQTVDAATNEARHQRLENAATQIDTRIKRHLYEHDITTTLAFQAKLTIHRKESVTETEAQKGLRKRIADNKRLNRPTIAGAIVGETLVDLAQQSNAADERIKALEASNAHKDMIIASLNERMKAMESMILGPQAKTK